MQGSEPATDQTASSRQLVILSGEPPAREGALSPIGVRREILSKLAKCNTAPDTTGDGDVLYGPGFRIELAPNQDPLTQMLVTVNEEEIGWQVLTHLVHHFHWKLLDPTTGRELSSQPDSPPPPP